jgi:hypothetical protein
MNTNYPKLIIDLSDTVAHLRAEVERLRRDKERLDWLEKKFALWNQGSVLSKMDGEWFCNSGCHEGTSAREAIDSAMGPAISNPDGRPEVSPEGLRPRIEK